MHIGLGRLYHNLEEGEHSIPSGHSIINMEFSEYARMISPKHEYISHGKNMTQLPCTKEEEKPNIVHPCLSMTQRNCTSRAFVKKTLIYIVVKSCFIVAPSCTCELEFDKFAM